MMREIYLDCAATTPVDPRVLAAMTECLEREHANPSSSHSAGRRARALVERARAAVAERLGVPPPTLVFTSGATESNNLALAGMLAERGGERAHLVTPRIAPRPAPDTAKAGGRRWVEVTYVARDPNGRVPPDAIAVAIGWRTSLVS